jgi:hypothetical protein
MSDFGKRSKRLQPLQWLICGSALLFAASNTAFAQLSEIDSYDRAVISQAKDAALAFIEEFRSSHLVGDLIESLRPDVARAVCTDLPSGVSRARRACDQLRNAPVAEAPAGSEEVVVGVPQSGTIAAPTQPIETQPIGGALLARPMTGAVAAGQSGTGVPVTTTAAGASPTTGPTTEPLSSASPSGPVATAPPTPIKSRPTVYVRADSTANILAQARQDAAIVGTPSSNTPLTVVGRDRSWLQVLDPGSAGQTGWVHTSGLQLDAGGIKVGPPLAATGPAVTSAASTTTALPTQTQVATGPSPSIVPAMPTTSAATASATDIPAAGPVIRVWLASLKSRELAERDWRYLQATYGDLLANLAPTVRQVDLGPEKGGIWYRVYAGPLASRDEARALCMEFKSRSPRSNCLTIVE